MSAMLSQLQHTLYAAEALGKHLGILRDMVDGDPVTLKKLQADAERAIEELRFYIQAASE